MRFMDWSWPELLACPADYVEVIAEESRREAEGRREASRAARSSGRRRR